MRDSSTDDDSRPESPETAAPCDTIGTPESQCAPVRTFLDFVRAGDLSNCQRLLTSTNAGTNNTDSDGNTALIIALKSKHFHIVTWLLSLPAEHQVDINHANTDGTTALIQAVKSLAPLTILNQLTSYTGINPYLRDRTNQTALIVSHNSYNAATPLIHKFMTSTAIRLGNSRQIHHQSSRSRAAFHLLNLGVDASMPHSPILGWSYRGHHLHLGRRIFESILQGYANSANSEAVWQTVYQALHAQSGVYMKNDETRYTCAQATLRKGLLLSLPISQPNNSGSHALALHVFSHHHQHYIAYCNRGFNGEDNARFTKEPSGINIYRITYTSKITNLIDKWHKREGLDNNFWLKLEQSEGGVTDDLGLQLIASIPQATQKFDVWDCTLRVYYSEVLLQLMLQQWKSLPDISLSAHLVDSSLKAVKPLYDRFKLSSRKYSYQALMGLARSDTPIHAYVDHHIRAIKERAEYVQVKHQLLQYCGRSTDTPPMINAISQNIVSLEYSPTRNMAARIIARDLDPSTLTDALLKKNVSLHYAASHLLKVFSSTQAGRAQLTSAGLLAQLLQIVNTSNYSGTTSLLVAEALTNTITLENDEDDLAPAQLQQAYHALLNSAFRKKSCILITHALKFIWAEGEHVDTTPDQSLQTQYSSILRASVMQWLPVLLPNLQFGPGHRAINISTDLIIDIIDLIAEDDQFLAQLVPHNIFSILNSMLTSTTKQHHEQTLGILLRFSNHPQLHTHIAHSNTIQNIAHVLRVSLSDSQNTDTAAPLDTELLATMLENFSANEALLKQMATTDIVEQLWKIYPRSVAIERILTVRKKLALNQHITLLTMHISNLNSTQSPNLRIIQAHLEDIIRAIPQLVSDGMFQTLKRIVSATIRQPANSLILTALYKTSVMKAINLAVTSDNVQAQQDACLLLEQIAQTQAGCKLILLTGNINTLLGQVGCGSLEPTAQRAIMNTIRCIANDPTNHNALTETSFLRTFNDIATDIGDTIDRQAKQHAIEALVALNSSGDCHREISETNTIPGLTWVLIEIINHSDTTTPEPHYLAVIASLLQAFSHHPKLLKQIANSSATAQLRHIAADTSARFDTTVKSRASSALATINSRLQIQAGLFGQPPVSTSTTQVPVIDLSDCAIVKKVRQA